MRASIAPISKRLLSTFFVATLVLGLVPAAAFADDASGSIDADSVESSEEMTIEGTDPGIDDTDGSTPAADASAFGEDVAGDDVATDDDANLGTPILAGDVINQEMPLSTVAQAESTRSYFLAQTLESTKTVPVVSAKLPLDQGTNQQSQAGADGGQIAVSTEDKVTDGDLPAVSTEAGSDGEPEGGEDSDESDLGGAVTLPGVAAESTVVGAFEYLGMTFAVEPGGESVALVAVDYSKLPEEFIRKQVIVIPDMATPDELDYYSVTRIADNAFASLTKETANPDYTGCIELFSDEELLAETGISQEEVQELLNAEPVENDSIEPSDEIRTIVSMDGNVATLDDGSTYAFTNPLVGCTGILALGIPASVSSIEDEAFSGFETLQYLVVSDDNPEFASYDGALCSADLSQIRLIPEGRLGTVRVASSTVMVGSEVFSHCPSVDTVIVDPDSEVHQWFENTEEIEQTGAKPYQLIASDAKENEAKLFFDLVQYDDLVQLTQNRSDDSITSINVSTAISYGAQSGSIIVVSNSGKIGVSRNGTQVVSGVSRWEDTWQSGWTLFPVGHIHFYNQNLELTIIDVSRSGYTFESWDGINEQFRGDWDVTIGPRWTPNLCTITLDNQGASYAGSGSIQFYMDNSFPNITPPSRTGYSFGGYYTGKNGTGSMWINSKGQNVLGSCSNAGNLTLYAKWTPNTYTVSFDANAGSNGQTESVTATFDASMPSISTNPPERAGYTFCGWYDTSASSGGTQYYTAAGASARNWDKTSNTTLYARWSANGYTVSLDVNGSGDGVDPATIATFYDAAVTLPTPPRPGYTFLGWDTAQDGSGVRYGAGAHPSLNLTTAAGATVTLYAQWQVNDYAIMFEPNISAHATVEVMQTFDAPLPDLMTIGALAVDADGFSFAGYFDAAGKQYYAADGTPLFDTWNVPSDTTLYAHWKYRIFFDKNDDEARASLPEGTLQEDGTVKVQLSGGTGAESIFIHDYDSDAPYIWATWHGRASEAAYPIVYLPAATRMNYPDDGSAASSFGTLAAWTYRCAEGERSVAAGVQLADQNALIGSLSDDGSGKSITLTADWKSSATKYRVRLIASTPFSGAEGIEPIASVSIENESVRTQVVEGVPYGSLLSQGDTPAPFVVPIAHGEQHVRFAGYYARANATNADGCYINADGTVDGTNRMLDRATLNAAGEIELYARWEVASYDVVFELTDADAGQLAKTPDAIPDLRYGSALPALSWNGSEAPTGKVPTRVGFSFRGYFDDDGIRYYDPDLKVDSDHALWHSAHDATVLHARWTYEVDLDMNLGEAGSARSADSVIAADGSVLKAAGGGASPIFKVSATERTSSDELDGFSLSEDVHANNVVPQNLSRLREGAAGGYRFVGFTTVRDDASTLIDGAWLASDANPDALLPQDGRNAVLYALWEAQPYTVVFEQGWADEDGAPIEPAVMGTPDVYDAQEADPIRYDEPLPEGFSGTAPHIEGYTFEGYFSESGKKYFDVNAEGAVVPARSGAASAIWTESLDQDGACRTVLHARYAMTSHKVTFDVTGGYADGYESGWDPSAYVAFVNLGSPLLPPNRAERFEVPERYGYTFDGWFSERDGNGVRYSASDGTPTEEAWSVDSSGVVHAAWKPKTFKVQWLFNFTQAEEPEGFYETEQAFGAALKLPESEPSRPGFSVFDGWFTDRGATKRVDTTTLFAPEGLEDRRGELVGDGIARYYASYSGAESYWVKLFAGEGGRFATDDTAFMPEDFRYAYSQDGATPVPVIVAGEEQEVELSASAQHLNARLADYSFAGWQEVEGTWTDNGQNYRSIADTAPGSVYGTDTVLPDGQVRLAGTLVDDTIPAKVMGNRTLRAVWRSEGAKIVLELGQTGMEGTDGVEGPAFAKDVCERLGFSPDGDGMALLWESPYGTLDLSSIAVCEGYRLVGFAREGDEMGEALLSIEASRDEPASAWAGTYVAIWEPLDYEIVFHANHDHDGASSAYDVTLRCSFDATLVLPAPASFPHLEDGGYGSYALKWWGVRPLETSSAHSAWRADAQVPFYEILSEAGEDEERTVHLYAQWVAPVSVTIPLFVNLAVDPDQDWAEVIVADWDRTDEDDGAFLGIQSRTRALFKVHSITCEVVNELIGDDGGVVPLVSAADGGPLPKGRMYLTVSSGRDDADGTELAFDLGEGCSRIVDGASTLANGTIFDATSAGFAVSERDATRYTRIPLRFGLRFAEGYDITDFRFADLMADDPNSNGALARVFYTIEAL